MARRKEAHGGGHGWFVTFADLMGLLVSFFVMLVAFSNQDAKKMQAVAGSMREAFGVQTNVRNSGLKESEGLLTRSKLKNAAHIRPEDSSVTPTTEASKHIMIVEHSEGLNIEIVDQDGSAMFPEGSREPYERTRKLIQKLAGPLKDTPYRISITGHTSASRTPPQAGYGPWNLSVDRANTVRQILEEEGYPSANIYKVAGRADTDPLFPEDRFMAPNRRVTITLIREAPPVPVDLQP
jgi:chemotaxis protein MotB